jgi:hypothetical protein
MKYLKLSLLFLLLNAFAYAQPKVEQWKRFEISLNQAFKGNPYEDVVLKATFTHADTTVVVTGFYDGGQTFRIRFMPEKTGQWQYKTSSNLDGLNNQKGRFDCVQATGSNHGIVRVNNTFGFSYADGKKYYPFGTTAYAWTHMPEDVQATTLATLRQSGFNKLRMCVFPKNYNLVKEEPVRFPFLQKDKYTGPESWDVHQFNPAFFQYLENRLNQLDEAGIEADLILFHPYDKGRWGFDALPNEVNLRYIRYVAARLSSFKNVWWSLANEWDLVKTKTAADWQLFAETVVKADPYRHLCSIHGATATYFDYWKPEFTHVSVQDEAPVINTSGVAMLRQIYHKPVICDEVGYEGNLTSRWGRYSPEEMTNLVWNGVIGGGYVTHGECYMFKDASDTIFWAKGGAFKGKSWKQIAFLRQIVEGAPGLLSMADISRDYVTATAGNGWYLIYFGKQMANTWMFNLPLKNGPFPKLKAGTRFKVDIIDAMDRTIQTCPQVFETAAESDYRMYDKDRQLVRLPNKPYMALRITEIK